MSDFLLTWSWDPGPALALALSAGLYGMGWVRLRRRSRGAGKLAAWRAWCYAGALLALVLVLFSPIAAYDEQFLFMHMIQHLLLVEIAAPLLLLGAPLLPLLWALPRDLRVLFGALFVPNRPLGRLFTALTHPLASVSVFIGVLAGWHVPAFYDAAQGRTPVHDLEHLLFLGSALLYWWPVIHPAGGRRRLSYALSIPYLLPPMFAGSLIGALLTFADRPLYLTYQEVPRLWGISVVEDQQIAGLIMWVPGGLVYLAPILVLLALMLRQEDRSGWQTPGEETGAEEEVHSPGADWGGQHG